MLYVAELNTKNVIHSIAHNFILQSQAGSVLRQKLPAGAEQNLGWEGRVEQAVSASSLSPSCRFVLFNINNNQRKAQHCTGTDCQCQTNTKLIVS